MSAYGIEVLNKPLNQTCEMHPDTDRAQSNGRGEVLRIHFQIRLSASGRARRRTSRTFDGSFARRRRQRPLNSKTNQNCNKQLTPRPSLTQSHRAQFYRHNNYTFTSTPNVSSHISTEPAFRSLSKINIKRFEKSILDQQIQSNWTRLLGQTSTACN